MGREAEADGLVLVFQKGWFSDESHNTYELMAQDPEYGLCGYCIDPHSCPQRRLRFMLRASVKSVFPGGFDVGLVVWPHGECFPPPVDGQD